MKALTLVIQTLWQILKVFFLNVTLIFDMDSLDLDKTGKILPQEIHMRNMKALSLAIQKLWQMANMLQFFVTNGQYMQ